MPRPTKSQIDAEILDGAAGLFAQHGFARASLQQIADALKYSKAGLLHHYPSKKALFDAVLERYEAETREQIAKVSQIPVGIERDRAVIENAIEFAFNWPGMSALGQTLGREGVGEDPRFVQLGLMLVEALGIDLTAPDLERLVRSFGALAAVNVAARVAVSMNLQRECRSHILAAAMDALGHCNDVFIQNH